MKMFLGLLLVFVFSTSGFGQTDKPQPNKWKGLVLDQTTAEQAIEKFGKPNSDKTEKIIVPAIGNLLTKELKQKKWRLINFKQIEGISNTLLVFDANNQLVLIHFEIKDLTTQAFINAYGIAFKPIFSGFDQAINSSDFSRDTNGNVYARNYPTTYFLFGASEKSFVVAGVANTPSFGDALKKSVGVPDSTLTYPGNVRTVELVSRTLENKDKIDVLK